MYSWRVTLICRKFASRSISNDMLDATKEYYSPVGTTEAIDGHRGSAFRDGRAIAELAAVVEAPAASGPVRQECAGVGLTGSERGCVRDSGNLDGCEALPAVAPVAELAAEVVAPTADGPVGQQRTRVGPSDCDRHRGGCRGGRSGMAGMEMRAWRAYVVKLKGYAVSHHGGTN